MDAITELFQIDFPSFIITIFVVLIAFKTIASLFEWIIGKLGIETRWMRKRREDHELLIKTAQSLLELQKKHREDVEQSIAHDHRIKDDLSDFMEDIRNSMKESQEQIHTLSEKRIHDRAQSLQIQKELTDSISAIVNAGLIRDEQIDALKLANKELLADKINQKYKEYILLKGIPEDEVDEFTSIHFAYKALGGNHSGDAKYEYVMEHLPVIPVEVKFIYKKEA